jgi:RNA polymerase sigma-70 factor (ECF subfamily)
MKDSRPSITRHMAHTHSSAGDKVTMDDAGSPRCDTRTLEFQSLLQSVELELYQYILCLVPNWANADDVLQETQLRLWKDFDHYQTGTSFRSWAFSVARYQVLTFRRQQQRSRIVFSQELIDTMDIMLQQAERNDSSITELRRCIDQLPPNSRELLRLCYGNQESVTVVAARSSRSLTAVYKALSRIRRALRECISLAYVG